MKYSKDSTECLGYLISIKDLLGISWILKVDFVRPGTSELEKCLWVARVEEKYVQWNKYLLPEERVRAETH